MSWKIVLWIHIIFGSLSLLTGLIPILSKKGSKLHKSFGKIFTIFMAGTAISSFFLALTKSNLFLFMLGCFTAYMLYTGNRFLKMQKEKSLKPHIVDWLALSIALLVGLAMLVFTVITLFKNANTMLIVAAVFSGLVVWMALEDLVFFRKGVSNHKDGKHHFMLTHITRMMGCYIATLTAFLVTNVIIEHYFIVWLIPTIILAPFIFKATNDYRKKHKIGKFAIKK